MNDVCERCGEEFDELQTVELEESQDLCHGCVRALAENVETYRWQDLYTEEQHERAVSLLSEMNEIECVIESYEYGQIIVHTPYVSSDIVADICDHFGHKIISFGPLWKEEGNKIPCMPYHGSIFEIVLKYDNSCDVPVPIGAKFFESEIDTLDENDRQF